MRGLGAGAECAASSHADHRSGGSEASDRVCTGTSTATQSGSAVPHQWLSAGPAEGRCTSAASENGRPGGELNGLPSRRKGQLTPVDWSRRTHTRLLFGFSTEGPPRKKAFRYTSGMGERSEGAPAGNRSPLFPPLMYCRAQEGEGAVYFEGRVPLLQLTTSAVTVQGLPCSERLPNRSEQKSCRS
jgi:hypothetical protein